MLNYFSISFFLINLIVGGEIMRFSTERLIIRDIRESDLEHLLEMNNNPAVMRYIATGGFNPTSAKEELKAIQRQLKYYKKHEHTGLWMIDTTFDTIGWISIKYNEDLKGYELGYRLKERYWSNGYATEACEGLIEYISRFNINSLYAVALNTNYASTRVMEKIGMKMDHRGHLLNDNVLVYKLGDR